MLKLPKSRYLHRDNSVLYSSLASLKSQPNRKSNGWQLPQRRGSRRWPWQRGAAPWGTRDASSWSLLCSCAGALPRPPHALWPVACTSSTWTLRRCRTQSRGQQTWCKRLSANACVEREKSRLLKQKGMIRYQLNRKNSLKQSSFNEKKLLIHSYTAPDIRSYVSRHQY